MMTCDPVTGACLLPEPAASASGAQPVAQAKPCVHYIGDPMCSWCWGIQPVVSEMAAFCAAEGIDFALTVGGLRAGGGDLWNADFTDFLRAEWRHIGEVTGQPFGSALLDAPHFDYDTEPACRAVVTVQMLGTGGNDTRARRFFSAVQRRFYVEGRDPKETCFYADLCREQGVDFEVFRALFESAEARQATQAAFLRCRQWGVRSFPTLAVEWCGEMLPLAVGFTSRELALSRLRQLLAG
ncbi:DsbA family protein [Pseudomonas aeruginosa]|uniref:DsbA family protein n=1 Tax=Pseudomonas aeruginosa TaxID=287 RepID=UPI000FC3F4EF|nr:protein-disulfide isomerase [Pseudomonas aeruginosa]MDG3710462.1 protein-disulfide isomerase [Pseudomonas aeruginosa]MDG3819569.1 protein-disulfide isomerase [Pseudomonas aeruginosa]NNB83642.1 protein-disulfide isomerase [Pseudomonas aeruginosa]NPW34986.1 protein-disulfide isomerase [Pseudomonas aeruginosa]RUB28887.1 protein-disulfide isomerase [Pseudomonas aeruginosa]